MNVKKFASTAAVIVLYVLIIGFAMFMILTGRALYLSGKFISEYALGFGVFAVLILVQLIIKCVGFFGKNKEDSGERGVFDIVMIVVSCIILVLAVLGFIRQTGKSENERIDLPDGNTVLLTEKTSSANETVSVDVYKISGIIAVKIGGIYDEDILMDNFLRESRWGYTYDEDEKLLTIGRWFYDEDIVLFDEEDDEDDEYNEEYDMTMWEEYFILE